MRKCSSIKHVPTLSNTIQIDLTLEIKQIPTLLFHGVYIFKCLTLKEDNYLIVVSYSLVHVRYSHTVEVLTVPD